MSAERTAARRILITGVGRGLGRELARVLAAEGHHVWGSTRSGAVDAELGLAGSVAMDLLEVDTISGAVAELTDRLDGLDTLVNCAGVDARAFGAAAEARGPFDLTAEAVNGVMAVNLTAPMVLTSALLPLLEKGSSPLVLNVSSQLGSMEVGARAGRDAVYNASKAALNMWTLKAADAGAARGITVVALHPGWVQTDMGGASAALTTDESATAIAATMAGLGPADNGRFLRWDGTDHPW